MVLNRKLVIIDVGCRWGFAEKFIAAGGMFQIYGFDPDAHECQRLRELYAGHSVALVPIGLAGTAGTKTLYLTQEPACSSLLVPDTQLTENYPALRCARLVGSTEVETTTLDQWAVENGVASIDYVKLDTQGTELEILKGGVNSLRNVRCLEVEVEFNPIYQGQPIFSDVDLFLRSQGFVLWKLTNHVHYSSDGAPSVALGEDSVFYDDLQQVKHAVFGGQLYWANAHYVKQEVLNASSITEARVLMDIALFDQLGMPDVVNHLRARTAQASTT